MAAARTLLVTGASSGLGAAFARAALAAGHHVVGTVRRSEDRDAFDAASDGRGHALLLDLADSDAIPAVVGEAERVAGPIDILVNNAGFGHEGALEESPLDALKRQFDVNVVGQVAMIRAVLPGMRARRAGHIVNVTSMAGSVGLPGISFYCGAKFAMEGISEALAKEVRPLGIAVTTFAPGQFRTDWAGRSMERAARSIADYDAIIDPLRDARLARSGRQPGDPDKAAALLMRLVEMPHPPSRVFVGADALALAGQKIKRMQAEIDAWREASAATGFDT